MDYQLDIYNLELKINKRLDRITNLSDRIAELTNSENSLDLLRIPELVMKLNNLECNNVKDYRRIELLQILSRW